jgi:hypothetical protein
MGEVVFGTFYEIVNIRRLIIIDRIIQKSITKETIPFDCASLMKSMAM